MAKTQRKFAMLNIKEIIQSSNASTNAQAELLLRAMKCSTSKKIVLDFSELNSCTTWFLNASIGKYYGEENRKLVRTVGVPQSWRWKIKQAIDLATNEETRNLHREIVEKLLSE